MSGADKLYDLAKSLPEWEVDEILDFAQYLIAKRERERREGWEVFDKYQGRYDGGKWQREELYDRACLR
jgi:hypothetical protein